MLLENLINSTKKLDIYEVDCDHFRYRGYNNDPAKDVGKLLRKNGITPECTRVPGRSKGILISKYRCNLKCDNGNENVWSVRPLKCKVFDGVEYDYGKKVGETRGYWEVYKWRPSGIKNIDTLCDNKKVNCDNIEQKYNLSNKLLSWEKVQVNARQTRFDFS